MPSLDLALTVLALGVVLLLFAWSGWHAGRCWGGTRWNRVPAESVVVVGMDDFLRVELRLSISDSIAAGSALATSDAAAERDASGRLRDYRRAWKLVATHAPCENMPAPAR